MYWRYRSILLKVVNLVFSIIELLCLSTLVLFEKYSENFVVVQIYGSS